MSARSATGSVVQARLAMLVVVGWVCLGAYAAVRPGAGNFLDALSSDLGALLVVLGLALGLGVPLGALAGSGPRFIDTALAFMTGWIAAVPAVLLMAFVRPEAASLFVNLLWLGALRSLEVGWVVRGALLRAAARDETWAERSLGYMPLSIFLRQRLPASAPPALAHLAFTPVWTFLLDAVGVGAGLGAVSSERSLGALVASPAAGVGILAIAGSVAAVLLLTWALAVLGGGWSLRLARK